MTVALADTYFRQKVLLTGHTGFKGSWLALWLHRLGADVTGFSDIVPTDPSAFSTMRIADLLDDRRGEISDFGAVQDTMQAASPSIVFHLAAQPIVRLGFDDPLHTFRTNVMGTAAVLEAARHTPGVRAVVVVTSDKVYENSGSVWGYREGDPLGGHEPYGASKAAAEIVASTYLSAGFHDAARSANRAAIATVRAGNVIGGGDWAANRLIPDIVRAEQSGTPITLRQPRSTRPWQHVLEPLGGYLCIGQRLLQEPDHAPRAMNFGPQEAVMPDVEAVARQFVDALAASRTEVVIEEDPNAGEAAVLRVDSSLAQARLGWKPAWSIPQAIAETAAWYSAYLDGSEDLRTLSVAQIDAYCAASPVTAISAAT